MKIFVINLERDVERRQSILKQFNQIQLPFEFSNGVLGSSLTQQQKTEWYDDKRAFRNLCQTIVPAHIGCSLSHVHVYQKIIDQNLPYALILEDDVILPEKLGELLSDLEKIIHENNAEVILLSPAQGKNKKNRDVNELIFLLPYKNGYFTSSYIVTQSAAKALIKDLFPINNVADCWNQLVRHRVIDLYVLNTGFIEQDQITFGSSTNNDVIKYKKKGLWHLLKFKACRAFWKAIEYVNALYDRNFNPYKGIFKK